MMKHNKATAVALLKFSEVPKFGVVLLRAGAWPVGRCRCKQQSVAMALH
jgi:hypothetical protein